jgi:putative Holliday junction resolvase
MRILGIDYGTKRIGIALSNEDCTFALPLKVVPNIPTLAEEIKKIANEQGLKEIVMGESHNYKGEPNIIMDSIQTLKRQLQDAGFIVILEPEYMTSMQAERFQGKHDKIDASAAAIILQSYLDKKNSQKTEQK